MRLIFKTVREELDEMLHDAKRDKKTVVKIQMTREELDRLLSEMNQSRFVPNEVARYCGYTIEVVNE